MCGRFALALLEGPNFEEWLGIDGEASPDDRPSASWNIAPSQTVDIVGLRDGRRAASTARWGLVPHWWSKPLAEFRATTFNARSEEVAQKPMFRDAWAKRRCLIPATGWYEWSGPKGAKIPWFITIKRNTPGFWFAGLWSQTMIGGARLRSCTILTTAAGEATRHLHPGTPVVLAEEDVDRWLDTASDPAPLMRAPEDARVDLWQVSPAVGKVQNNGPELTERVA